MPSAGIMQFQLNQWFWTERWDSTLFGPAAQAKFLAVKDSRLKMLAPPAQLTKIYTRAFLVYGQPPNPLPGVMGINASQLIFNSPYTSGGGEPGPGKGADNASNAIRVTAYSGQTFRRNVWIRGQNDISIVYTRGNQPVIAELLRQQLANYLNAVSSATLGWYGLIRGGVNAPVPLTGIGADMAGRLTVTAAAGGTWTAGTQIQVTGARGTNLYQTVPGRRGVNGPHWIFAVNGNVLTLDLFISTFPGPPTWLKGGTVSNRRMQFYPCDAVGEAAVSAYVAEKRPAQKMGQSRARRRVQFRNTN